jgi:hypothetical protein
MGERERDNRDREGESNFIPNTTYRNLDRKLSLSLPPSPPFSLSLSY